MTFSRVINGIPVNISPHPITEGWWNVVCGNSRKNTTICYANLPTEEQLTEAARKYEERFT